MKDYLKFKEKIDYTFQKYNEKVAIEYLLENGEKKEFHFGKIYQEILFFSKVMEEHGLKAGDRVAILTPHSPYGIVTCIACAYWNLTSVLFDVSLPEQEIKRLLELSDVRAIFTTNKFCKMECVKQYFNIPVFDIEKENFSHSVFEGFSHTVKMEPTKDPEDEVIAILFSSGTTSSMKGIMITYQSIPITRDIIADLAGLKAEMSYLLVLPFNHIAGFAGGLTYLLTGCTLGLIENVNASKLQKGLLEFQPSYFAMVPRVYEVMEQKIRQAVKEKGKVSEISFNIMLMFSGFLRKYFGINIGRRLFAPVWTSVFGKNIFGLATGATPCKKETERFFLNMGIIWANMYATTETGVPIASTGIHDRYPVGAVGNVKRDKRIQVIIKNPDKKGCGEICVKSPLLMKGYFRDFELTKNAFEEGYFKTGDYGYIDRKGYLYVTGRMKESILLHNGKKISPVDVDAIYQKIVPEGCIVASCGINCKGQEYDEIYLFVQKQSECVVTKEEIRRCILECSAKTSENYRVRHIQFVEEIPYTSVGKVKRFLLKDMIHSSEEVKKQEMEYKENILYDIQKYPLRKHWYHKVAFKIAGLVSRLLWKFEVDGIENIPETGNYIICPNHESHLDGLWVWTAMGKKNPGIKNICCMAKYEHLLDRSSRFWMTMLGGIPVDRTGNTAIALRRTEECLKKGNFKLLIHPEGTRTRDGSMNKLKEGAALLAIKSGYPLIPVQIEGAYEIFPYDKKRPKLFCIERKQRYTLKIHFRKPIYPNTNDAKNLTERLYYGITGKEYKIYDNLITSQKKNVIVAQPEDWLLGLIQIYCPDLYITEESKLKEELGIDSLNMYEIACKIEERIHVDITNKLGEIVTVSDLRCLTYSENTLER